MATRAPMFFLFKMILAFPQNGKYPWIGVFKGVYNTGIGNRLGGCAGTLVADNW